MAAKMAATAYISVTNSARRLVMSGGSAVRLARPRRQRISNDKERVSAPAHRVWRGQTPISGQGRGPVGRSPRPKGTRAGWGSWEWGSQLPPHQLGVWGSAVSSPGGVRSVAVAAKRFSCSPETPGVQFTKCPTIYRKIIVRLS